MTTVAQLSILASDPLTVDARGMVSSVTSWEILVLDRELPGILPVAEISTESLPYLSWSTRAVWVMARVSLSLVISIYFEDTVPVLSPMDRLPDQ